MKNLATKYRPADFGDICCQESIVKILNKQIETGTFKNCYLFSGPSGCGKTTIARILANKINNGVGIPEEIDGASNNGVDNVRQIIDSATQRSLDAEYKVFIIDECHAITSSGWNAFLKCIEEPPKYTIFMFCTTDQQKVPVTIQNRCQVFNLGRISDDGIIHRLDYICNQEKYSFTIDSLEYICKLADGSLRQAITLLDKTKDFSTNLTLESVIESLGNYSYDIFFNLVNARIDNDKKKTLSIIESMYLKGVDLKLFIDSYLDFILDLSKYCIFGSLDVTKIPSSQEDKIKYTINLDDNIKFFNMYLEKVLNIKQSIKYDTNQKTTIEAMLISW